MLDATQIARRRCAGLLVAASTLAAAGLVFLAIAPLHAVAQVRESQQSGSTAERRQASRSNPLDRALYETAESGELQISTGCLTPAQTSTALSRATAAH